MRRVVALGVVVGVVLLARPADAHLAAPGVRNVLDQVAGASGVSVSIRTTAADEVVLTDRSAASVLVLDGGGAPFLRFSPRSVEANTNSVAWFASESLAFNPITSVPGVDPRRGPTWIPVAATGTWQWLDPRLRPDQPADVVPVAARTPARLASWTIPLVVDGAAARVAGHREFVPIQGTYQQELLTPLAGLQLAVVGGAGSAVPVVLLQNKTAETITVLGAGGEPLLRFTPTAVDANTASPSWVLQGAACCGAPAGLVSPAAAPRWQRVANQGSYSWLEERGIAPTEPGRTRTWSFPVLVGSRRDTVRARVVWQPLAGTPGRRSSGGLSGGLTGALLGGGAGFVVALVGVALVASRRRRPIRSAP